jgi:GTP cyclohydrolase I
MRKKQRALPLDPATIVRHHDLIKMANGVKLLLEGLGLDWRKDPNYRETPLRVARLYHEMLSPAPNNWTAFPTEASDLIVLRGHKVFALCPHHLLPVELTCTVGYIPNEKTIGLSKLGRVVEEQLVRPLLQEDLANLVADALDTHLKPKGAGVILAGVHGCMRFRGIRSEGDVVISAMRGVLLLNPAARQEFLEIARM